MISDAYKFLTLDKTVEMPSGTSVIQCVQNKRVKKTQHHN